MGSVHEISCLHEIAAPSLSHPHTADEPWVLAETQFVQWVTSACFIVLLVPGQYGLGTGVLLSDRCNTHCQTLVTVLCTSFDLAVLACVKYAVNIATCPGHKAS